MLALYFFSYPLSQVTMITGLIIVGLIIDLGGAPNHHRLGFQVSIKANWKSSTDNEGSTGKTPVSSQVLNWNQRMLAWIASSAF